MFHSRFRKNSYVNTTHWNFSLVYFRTKNAGSLLMDFQKWRQICRYGASCPTRLPPTASLQDPDPRSRPPLQQLHQHRFPPPATPGLSLTPSQPGFHPADSTASRPAVLHQAPARLPGHPWPELPLPVPRPRRGRLGRRVHRHGQH